MNFISVKVTRLARQPPISQKLNAFYAKTITATEMIRTDSDSSSSFTQGCENFNASTVTMKAAFKDNFHEADIAGGRSLFQTL